MMMRASVCLAFLLILQVQLSSSAIMADVQKSGTTVSPEYHRSSGKAASRCPMTHPFPFADRKSCCSVKAQSNSAGCLENSDLQPESPVQCCQGQQVACEVGVCRRNPEGNISGDCSNANTNGTAGVYTLFYDPQDKTQQVDVFCTSDGWTVIQSRGQFDNPEDYFYRGWEEYKAGFGVPGEEQWLGLDVIHRLTNNAMGINFGLRVDMEKVDGTAAYASYNSFSLSDEQSNYVLNIAGYVGTSGDSLAGHKGQAFSTNDNDHDTNSGNCALSYKGAWWYTSCHASNLNGLNLNGDHSSYANGINWSAFSGYNNSLKTVTMAIKPI